MPELYKEKILKWIDDNRDGIISDFKELLRIPSLTGEETEAQRFMKDKMEELGLEMDIWEPDIDELFKKFPEIAQYPSTWQPELDLVLRFKDICTLEQLQKSGYADKLHYKGRPNVVGIFKGNGGGKSLILNAHIDVVTVGDVSRWDYEPFGAEQVGGKIYGRGACDAKGSVISMLKALEALKKSDVALKGDVIFQSVVNEEHSGNGTLSCVARGYKADAAILAEATGSSNYAKHSGGGVYWEIEISGEEVHTGTRWKDGKIQGVSAIEKAGPVINALVAQEAKVNRDEVKFSLGLGVIKGGTYATATAKSCTISGVVYFSPSFGTGVEGIRQVKNIFKEAIDEACKGDEWLTRNKPDVYYLHYDDAYHYPDGADNFMDVLKNSGKEIFQSCMEEIDFSACDARHLGNQGGIPTIIYGPGDLKMAHCVNEGIEEEEIIEATKVLAMTICNWCETA